MFGAGAPGLVFYANLRNRKVKVALKTLRSCSASALYRLNLEDRSLIDLSHPRLDEVFGHAAVMAVLMSEMPGAGVLAFQVDDTATTGGYGRAANSLHTLEMELHGHVARRWQGQRVGDRGGEQHV